MMSPAPDDHATDTIIESIEIESELFEIERPRDDEPLVRRAVERGELDPSYWARIWPTSRAMAAWALRSPMLGPESRVLEIGCGLGLVGIAAARRGATVLMTDFDERAIALARRNAERNGADASVEPFDWRELPLESWSFDILIASDVLYRPAAHDEIARLIATLARRCGCVGIIADPNRPASDAAPAAFERAGLRVWSTPLPGGRIFLVQA